MNMPSGRHPEILPYPQRRAVRICHIGIGGRMNSTSAYPGTLPPREMRRRPGPPENNVSRASIQLDTSTLLDELRKQERDVAQVQRQIMGWACPIWMSAITRICEPIRVVREVLQFLDVEPVDAPLDSTLRVMNELDISTFLKTTRRCVRHYGERGLRNCSGKTLARITVCGSR